jgi:hypothetical protein
MVQDNSNSHLLFHTVSIAFIPGEILSENTCRSEGPLPNLGRLTVVHFDSFLSMMNGLLDNGLCKYTKK